MAKKSKIVREYKLIKNVQKYAALRAELKGIIKEIETTELAQQEHEHEIVLHDDIKILLSQAANFIERQEEELKIYREREEKHISLLKGAEKQINKTDLKINPSLLPAYAGINVTGI